MLDLPVEKWAAERLHLDDRILELLRGPRAGKFYLVHRPPGGTVMLTRYRI